MFDGLFCNECGTELPASYEREPGDERTPCPNCGSSSRKFARSVKERITASDSVNVSIIRDEAPVLVSWARRRLVFRIQPSLKWTTHGVSITLGLIGLLIQNPALGAIGVLLGGWLTPAGGRILYRLMGGSKVPDDD